MAKQLRLIFRNEAGFAIFLTLLFAALNLVGILNHEMWRDELQSWMVARDSGSVAHLFQNLKYETGHSFLWHFCLFWISRLTRSPIAMQLFHGATAIAVAYIIARYSPFTRLQKTLILFGYFPFYEYAIISRNYSLSLLLIVAFCALFQFRQKSYLPLAVLLFLLANTNSYSLLVAVSLGLTLVVDFLLTYPGWVKRPTHTPQNSIILAETGFSDSPQPVKRLIKILDIKVLDILVSLALWIGGILLGLKLMLPPSDGGVVSVTPQGFDLGRFVATLAIAWKSYLPLPGLSLRFWNTNLIDDGYAAVLSLVVLPFAIAGFMRKPVVFFLYSFGSLSIFWMVYSRFLGVLRHWGYLYLFFFICLWLSSYFPESAMAWQRALAVSRPGKFFSRYSQRFLSTILCVQCIACLLAYSIDLTHPFSAARQTAQFIQGQINQGQINQDQNLGETMIVGDNPFAALSVSGYLDKPLYYPARDSLGTYAIYDNRNRLLTPPDLLAKVNDLLTRKPQPLLLVLNYPLELSTIPFKTGQVKELARFTGAIVRDEEFYIYQVRSQSRPINTTYLPALE